MYTCVPKAANPNKKLIIKTELICFLKFSIKRILILKCFITLYIQNKDKYNKREVIILYIGILTSISVDILKSCMQILCVIIAITMKMA